MSAGVKRWTLLKNKSLGLIALNRLVGKARTRGSITKMELQVTTHQELRTELKRLADEGRSGGFKYTFQNGDIYDGMWVNGTMEGEGTMYYNHTGNSYKGEWKQNKRHGRGAFVNKAKGTLYEGEWRDGMCHGPGTFTDNQNNTFKGEWSSGAMCGRGVYTFANGDVYEGEFHDNEFAGRGKFTYPNGDKYEGDWKDGMQHGGGTFLYREHGHKYDGAWLEDKKWGFGKYTAPTYEYEGEWADDCMCGKGQYTYASGDKYVGDWRDDQEQGFGTYYNIDGSRYEGDWQAGNRSGKGVFIASDGAKYDGEWKEDKKCGYGTYFYTSGAKYQGEWIDDQPHGRGIYIYRSGKKYRVEYDAGKCIRKTLMTDDDPGTPDPKPPKSEKPSGKAPRSRPDTNNDASLGSTSSALASLPGVNNPRPSSNYGSDPDAKTRHAKEVIDEGRRNVLALTRAVDDVEAADPTIADACRDTVAHIMKMMSSALPDYLKEDMSELSDQLAELLQMWDDQYSAYQKNQLSPEETKKKQQAEEDARRKRIEDEKRMREKARTKAKIDEVKRKKQAAAAEKDELDDLRSQVEEARERRKAVTASAEPSDESEIMKQLHDAQEEVEHLKKELAKRPSKKIEEMMKKIENENSATVEYEKKSMAMDAEANAQIEDLEAKMKACQDQIDEIENGIDQANRDLDSDLEHQEDTLLAELKTKEAEMEKQNQQCRDMEDEMAQEKEAMAKEKEAEMEKVRAQVMRDASKGGLKTGEEAASKAQKEKEEVRTNADAQLAKMKKQLLKAQEEAAKNSTVAAQAEAERLRKLYDKEVKERKRLYNELIDLKGNIRVYVRVRPMKEAERLYRGGKECLTFPGNDSVVVQPDDGPSKTFEFDKVFPPGTTQEKVFEDTLPMITSVVDGYNICMFAYGQTGAGKSFTMTGPPDNPGIMKRSLAELFRLITERQGTEECTVQVSTLEIYNETIRDLQSNVANQKKYTIKTDPKKGQYVENLMAVQVSHADAVDDVMNEADKNRSVSKTNMNAQSSRSHMILYIQNTMKNLETGAIVHSKMSVVDLAGSERIDKSGATGSALLEAQHINKSLSALGDVIAQLGQKSKHIPYRNSTLTHLLQDSLGGKAKTLMFANSSPLSGDVVETLSTLAFAARARSVELGKATKSVSHS